jgi:hypothetical protein
MTEVTDSMTLAEVRDWLREAVKEGVHCPCCNQMAKVYNRKITSRMAFTLIEVYRAAGTDWCHVPSTVTFTGDSGEISKLRYWGLVVEGSPRRDDGGRAGMWRITDFGERFVKGNYRVPKYAHIYDGRRLGFDDSVRVSIRDALGTKFNYDELMEGR